MIWNRIYKVFKGKSRQLEVVKLLIRYGLSVKSGEIYLDNLKVTYSSVASALSIDRRVVVEAIKTIEKDEFLREFFSKLKPAGPFLIGVGKLLGYTTLIVVPYRDQPGIISSISSILADANINIVQVVAEEPHLTDEQKLYIIVEGDVPGEIINKISKLDIVKNLILG